MMYAAIRSRRLQLASLATSIVAIIVSIAIWSINTVLSILLIVATIFIFVFGACDGLKADSVHHVKDDPTESKSSGDYSTQEMERIMRSISKMIERELEHDGISDSAKKDKSRVQNTEDALIHDIPVIVIEGIRETHQRNLVKSGIHSVSDLSKAKADAISKACNVEIDEARQWLFDARTLVVGAKITSVIELAMSTSEELAAKIENSVKRGVFQIPEGVSIDLARIRRLIGGANRLVSTVERNELDDWWES